MADKREERKQLLLARYNWSKRWRRPWDDKWLRWYKAFRGAVPDLPEEAKDRSNLHIPKTYSAVDTVRSKILATVFANRPWISYVPHGPDDVESARKMESVVDFQIEKGESYPKFYNLVTDMLVFGGCPFEAGWRHEPRIVKVKVPVTELGILVGYREVEEEVPDWDDPDWQPFSIDDLFPDPEGTTIDDCAWVIRRRYITEAELKQKDKEGVYHIEDFNDLKSALNEMSEGKQDRLAAIGASYEQADAADVGGRRYEVLDMWEDKRVSTLINQRAIVRDERNPYDHGKKPLGFAKFDPVSGEFYGVSLVEVIEHLQRELNTTRNQRIDAVSLVLNKMWMVKEGIIAPADLVSRQGGIIWVNHGGDFDDVIKEVSFSPPAINAAQEEAMIDRDIQDATGTYNEARGAPSTEKRTATENAIRDRAVSLRFEVKARLFESYGLKRLGFFYDQLNQQFIGDEDPVQVRVKNPDGSYRWDVFTGKDLRGRFEYQPSGTALDATLDALNYRDNLLALYDRFREDPHIQVRELKKRIIESFGIKDAEKLLKSEQQVTQEQIAALQGGGGVGGGAIIPEEIAQGGQGGPIPAVGGPLTGQEAGP